MKSALACLAALLAVSHAAPERARALTLCDGGTHLIDGVLRESVFVCDSTTLAIVDPAVISDQTATGLADVVADTATVNFAGGALEHDLIGMGRSTLNVTGGAIGGLIGVMDDSLARIFGGSFDGVNTSGSAMVRIFGSGFEIDGAPVGPGFVQADYGFTSGNLTAMLFFGGSADVFFFDLASASSDVELVLLTVPEPSVALLLGLNLLALRIARRFTPRRGVVQ